MSHSPSQDTKLEAVVRSIMASGAACFTDRLGRGLVGMNAPLPDALGDFPREFLTIRPSIIDDLADALAEVTA